MLILCPLYVFVVKWTGLEINESTIDQVKMLTTDNFKHTIATDGTVREQLAPVSHDNVNKAANTNPQN